MGGGPLAGVRRAVVGRGNALPKGWRRDRQDEGEGANERSREKNRRRRDGMGQTVPGGIYVQVTTANAGRAGTPVMAAMALGQRAG